MPIDDEIDARWRRHVDDLRNLLHDALDNRHLIAAVVQYGNRHPPRPIHQQFVSHLFHHHLQTLLLTVRKVSDRDEASVSLRNLLASLQANAGRLTRERHLRLWQHGYSAKAFEGFEHIAQAEFSQWVDSAKRDVVSAAKLNQDRKELWRRAKPIYQLVNEAIAHNQDNDTRDSNLRVTLEEAYGYLEYAWSLIRKCSLMVMAKDAGSLPKAPNWIDASVADLFELSQQLLPKTAASGEGRSEPRWSR